MTAENASPTTKIVNPPQILFPHITKRSVDVGGTICVIGVSEDKQIHVYRSLRTEISNAEYEEDMPEVPTGVTDTKVNENHVEDPMALAQVVVNSLIEITQQKQFLLGILHIECNGFESIIDFDEQHQIDIDIKTLMQAFLSGRLQDNFPQILKASPPAEVSLFVHHEKQNSILNCAWKKRSELFLQLEGISGRVYGIGTLEMTAGQWKPHFYVLEDDISNVNIPGKATPYPQTWETLLNKVRNKIAFPLVWFRFDLGYPFAFTQFPEWENARQLGVLKEAKETYDSYAVQSIAGLEKGVESDIEEDLLPEDEKRLKRRLKAIKKGEYNAMEDMEGAIKFFTSLLGEDADLQERAVIEIGENNPDLWFSRSVIARQEANLEKAKQCAEKAIRFEIERIKKKFNPPTGTPTAVSLEIVPPQPLLAKYWHEYGTIFNELHDLKDGIFALKNAYTYDPGKETYAHDLINTLLGANQLQEASALLARVLARAPSNAYGWFKLGELQFRSKQFKSAQDSFQKACDLAPNNPSFIANLGSTSLILQDWPRALEIFKKAVSLDSNQLNYWIGLGIAFAAKVNPIEANTFVSNFPKLLDKNSPDHHYVLGLARLALGRNKQALQKFNDAKVLNENNYQIWVYIADLSEQEGNLNAVATALVNMDRLQPNQLDILERLVAIREKLGNWALVVETTRRLIEIRPWEPRYWNALGMSQKKAKAAPEDVLASFQKAVDLDKTNVKSLSNLAWQQFAMNQFDHSLATVDSILRLEKNNISARNTLACVLFKQGETTNDGKLLGHARKEFDNLLKEVPEDAWVKSIHLKFAFDCIQKTGGKSDKVETIQKYLTLPPPKPTKPIP